MHLLPKFSGGRNDPQYKASGDQNIPQYQKSTCELMHRFMKAIILRMSTKPILSDDKYSMVEEAWRLAIEAQNCQHAIAWAPVDSPSVCQLPSGPFPNIDPQTQTDVNLELCWMLHYQTYNNDYTTN